jgi:hypothetical protein
MLHGNEIILEKKEIPDFLLERIRDIQIVKYRYADIPNRYIYRLEYAQEKLNFSFEIYIHEKKHTVLSYPAMSSYDIQNYHSINLNTEFEISRLMIRLFDYIRQHYSDQDTEKIYDYISKLFEPERFQ